MAKRKLKFFVIPSVAMLLIIVGTFITIISMKESGIKKEDYVTLPNNLNNFQQVEEMTQKILKDLHIETNKIYGVLKISSDYSDEYILYCKVNGRITENRIYTKKDLYV